MTAVTWERALDELDASVQRQERFVDGLGPAPADTTLPAVEGPVPAHLQVRAASLLQRIRDLEVRATALRTEQGPPAPRRTSAYS